MKDNVRMNGISRTCPGCSKEMTMVEDTRTVQRFECKSCHQPLVVHKNQGLGTNILGVLYG